MAKMIFVCARGVLVVTDSDGSYTVTASSGTGACLNNPSPACRRLRNRGPIPPGYYCIFRREINDPIACWDYLRNKFLGDWGDWLIPIRNPPGAPPFGRDGFYLHGGSEPGSAGCIDIGGFWHGTSETDRVLKSIMKVEVTELWVE
jgi:hypothetical protein